MRHTQQQFLSSRCLPLAAALTLALVWCLGLRAQQSVLTRVPVDLMGVRAGIQNSNDATVLSPGNAVLWVSPNGSDANSGSNSAAPCLTVSNALRSAVSGMTIFCAPGKYSLGTNQIVLPNNVNLFGAGMFLTEFTGYADCAGVEDSLAPTGGPQIPPRSGCRYQGFTMTCDTNALLAAFKLGAHSGSWSGLGISAANPPANLCCTNASAYDVRVRYGYFDAFHFNSTNYISFYAERCVGESQGDCVNVVIGPAGGIPYETIASLSSSIVFKDCWFTNDPSDGVGSYIFGNGGAVNPPSVLSYDRQVTFINCYGFGTNYTAIPGTGPFSIVVSNAVFTNPQPSLVLQGGNYACSPGTYWPSNCHGQASINGVSFWNGVSNAPFFIRGVRVQTNFVSGQVYTNNYGNTIQPMAYLMFTNTATAATATMQLRVVGVNETASAYTNQAGGTMLATAAATNYAVLSGEVPVGYAYTFTNTSVGGAAAPTILNGQLLVY